MYLSLFVDGRICDRPGWFTIPPVQRGAQSTFGTKVRATERSTANAAIATAHVVPPSIPSGYAIRELHTDELASRIVAFNAAFPGEELCVDAYQALRDCSLYVPRLDVVATSPSSSVAAFATLWLDAYNAVVQIEPAAAILTIVASASRAQSPCKR